MVAFWNWLRYSDWVMRAALIAALLIIVGNILLIIYINALQNRTIEIPALQVSAVHRALGEAGSAGTAL